MAVVDGLLPQQEYRRVIRMGSRASIACVGRATEVYGWLLRNICTPERNYLNLLNDSRNMVAHKLRDIAREISDGDDQS